jgi:hypothetical protein
MTSVADPDPVPFKHPGSATLHDKLSPVKVI